MPRGPPWKTSTRRWSCCRAAGWSADVASPPAQPSRRRRSWSASWATGPVDRRSTAPPRRRGPTSSVVTTGAVTAELASPTTVGDKGGSPVPAEDVRVTIDRARGAVRYETVVDGEMTVVASGLLPTTRRASTYTSSPLVTGLTMGLLPESATQLALVWAGDVPGSAQATAPLPGTGFQAFAVWHTGSASETTFGRLRLDRRQVGLSTRTVGWSPAVAPETTTSPSSTSSRTCSACSAEGTVGTKRISGHHRGRPPGDDARATGRRVRRDGGHRARRAARGGQRRRGHCLGRRDAGVDEGLSRAAAPPRHSSSLG